MKNTNKILNALLPLIASACMALGQDAGNQPPSDGQSPPDQVGPGGRPHRPPPPVLLALDANHDGVIDADEIANASTALKSLDKNGDGQLTMDELLPPRPMHPTHDGEKGPDGENGRPGPGGPGAHRPPLPPVLVVIDANHDGVIDADELANASVALKALDKNGDGKLTREELRPPRPPMNHPHEGQNEPGNPGFRPDGDGPPAPPAGNN